MFITYFLLFAVFCLLAKRLFEIMMLIHQRRERYNGRLPKVGNTSVVR
jgi:hypothetical protein